MSSVTKHLVLIEQSRLFTYFKNIGIINAETQPKNIKAIKASSIIIASFLNMPILIYLQIVLGE
jgi:hypothetical protein